MPLSFYNAIRFFWTCLLAMIFSGLLDFFLTQQNSAAFGTDDLQVWEDQEKTFRTIERIIPCSSEFIENRQVKAP